MWALACGVVARQAVFTLAVIAFEPVRPRLLAGRRETADLLRTGAGFSATAAFSFLANQGLNVVIAHMLGAAALGLFTRARALGVVSVRLGPVLADVLLPAMARRQHQTARLRAVHRAGVEILSLAVLPASLMLAVCAPEIVAVVLGARWEGAVPALRIVALAGALPALGALHVSVIRALGAVYRETWRRAVYFVVLMAGAWFASRWGLAGVAAATAAAWVVLQGLLAHLALGLLGTGWTALLRRLVPALWTGFWSTAATVASVARGRRGARRIPAAGRGAGARTGGLGRRGGGGDLVRAAVRAPGLPALGAGATALRRDGPDRTAAARRARLPGAALAGAPCA